MRAVAILLFLFLVFGCISEQEPEVVKPPMNITVIPPGYGITDFCMDDSECIRQNKCCDCGVGKYVNKYHLEYPECPEQACMCSSIPSEGRCIESRCTAKALYEMEEDIGKDIYFRVLGMASCTDELKPEKLVTGEWTMLNGSIGVPDVCHVLDVHINRTENMTTLNLTTREFQTQEECMECTASIPWIAEIIGYNGTVEVFYDEKRVYSDLDIFCGGEMGGCEEDSDCFRAGCNREICKSRFEPPVSTACEWRDCFVPGRYELECGCVDKKCTWKEK